jgi:hypothetical protein
VAMKYNNFINVVINDFLHSGMFFSVANCLNTEKSFFICSGVSWALLAPCRLNPDLQYGLLIF